MKFSFVIPVYSETQKIQNTCMGVLTSAYPDCEVIFAENNRQIGLALKWGIAEARNELIVKTGVDLPLGLTFIDEVRIIQRNFDFIYASKHIRKAVNDRPLSRKILSSIHTEYWKLVYTRKISDFTCDKFYRRSAILPLLEKNLCPALDNRFEGQLCRAVVRAGLRYMAVPAQCKDYRNRGVLQFLRS